MFSSVGVVIRPKLHMYMHTYIFMLKILPNSYVHSYIAMYIFRNSLKFLSQLCSCILCSLSLLCLSNVHNFALSRTAIVVHNRDRPKISSKSLIERTRKVCSKTHLILSNFGKKLPVASFSVS